MHLGLGNGHAHLCAGLDAELFGDPALVGAQCEIGHDQPRLSLAQSPVKVQVRPFALGGQRLVTRLTQFHGDGVDDPSLRFSGSLAEINNALDGLVFRAAPGFAGEGSIQIAANDGGNTGNGGAAGNAGAIVVNVESDYVNDAPDVGVPGPQQTAKNEPLTISERDANAIVIGESAYTNMRAKGHSVDNIVEGVLKVAVPARFSVVLPEIALTV